MPHDNENTVLQVGSDGLPEVKGDQGIQGIKGDTGANGLTANILSIECIYNLNPTANYFGSFVKNYVVEQGDRFVVGGASNHVFNTTIGNLNDIIIGELTGFLKTTTDKYTAHVQLKKVVFHSGVAPANNIAHPVVFEIFETADDSIKWRVSIVSIVSVPVPLWRVADPLILDIKELHFSLLVTAINT